MPKTMKNLKDNGKEVTSLNALDLLLLARTPFTTSDDGVISWDSLGSLVLDFLNYQIVPSVSSNNLTLAIKARNGNDASASNQIKFRVGNSIYTVSASVSFTKNAGTNWCNAGSSELATNAIDYFVYAIEETGASAGLKFGFSRIPYARTMGDFVNTTTSEKYIAGNWTNFTSTDAVQVIGRFRATLSAGASYNWSISSSVVVNRPIYTTDWLTWSPQYSANGSMTYTSVSTTYAKYKISPIQVDCAIFATGTTGGTASTQIQATLPFSVVDNNSYTITGAIRDATSGVTVVGTSAVNGATSVILARKTDSTNYGLGTGRIMQALGLYPI